MEPFLAITDQLFYYVQAIFVNIVPLVILIVCCMAMGWNAFKRNKSSTMNRNQTGRTQCVLHLAAATTVCHLVFEFPSVSAFPFPRSCYTKKFHFDLYSAKRQTYVASIGRLYRCHTLCKVMQ